MTDLRQSKPDLGRWTIRADGPDGIVEHFYADTDLRECPVVPCDDAAIERAAKALCPDGAAWERRGADAWLDDAREALRAAGETP